MSINYVWQMMHDVQPASLSNEIANVRCLDSPQEFRFKLTIYIFYYSNSAQLQVFCSTGDKKYSSPLSLPLRLLHLRHVV